MSYSKELYLFIFLPIVLLIYQLTPKKMRWAVLLLASYGFFYSYSKGLIVYLIATTLFTYIISFGIYCIQVKGDKIAAECERKQASEIKKNYKQKSKIVLIMGIVGLLLALGYTHYFEFAIKNVNNVLKIANVSKQFKLKDIAVPIGISFYSLEAIGYMVDVYWGKIKPDIHPFKLALFLSFFPQTMEGPIALYSQTADQLWAGNSVKFENIKKGYFRIFWGLFKTIVISTRLGMAVNTVFGHYKEYSGLIIVFAAIGYTAQLYMEFSGSIDIFIGSAKLFGVELPENFRQPFASKSASEFWTRWHISLGVWFKTYIFYPVSVSKTVKNWNKFAKKKISKNVARIGVSAICLFPVWMSNGLWHGPRWTYIFYGVYYFVILLIEVIFEPIRKSIVKPESKIWSFLLSVKTLAIIFVGELFFRADSLKIGFSMFKSIFRPYDFSKLKTYKELAKFGIDPQDLMVVILGCIVVGIVGYLKERDKLSFEKVYEFKTPVRWAIYYALIIAVIVLGAYGVGYQNVDLIYAGF